MPPAGGAERYWLELTGALAARHRVRVLGFGQPGDPEDGVPPGVEWTRLDPAARGSRWSAREARREALREALVALSGERRPDVIAGQLHAGPAAVTAARAVGAASVLFVPGYEAICHWAFGAGSDCRPATRCRGCPRPLALDPGERAAKWRERDAQDDALATASELIAPSEAMAETVALACGRRPHVAAPVAGAPAPVSPDRAGHLAAIASYWTAEKGVDLLAPLAHAVPERRFVIQLPPAGLPQRVEAALAAAPNVSLRRSPGTIEEVLEGAALLLVPSQADETFGRVAFEGLAAGVPVLASDAGGMREFVPVDQRVAPRDDLHAWRAAIRRQLEPDRWAEAQLAGLAAARRVLSARPLERAEQVLCAAAQRADGAAPARV